MAFMLNILARKIAEIRDFNLDNFSPDDAVKLSLIDEVVNKR